MESEIMFGTINALLTFFAIIAFLVISIIAQWKIFSKSGEKGWKSLIPIYNSVVLFKIVGLSPWLVLINLAVIIPIIGKIVVCVLSIIVLSRLSKAFGKGVGFTIGLVLLYPIFICILAFGDSKYCLNTNINENFDINNYQEENNDKEE